MKKFSFIAATLSDPAVLEYQNQLDIQVIDLSGEEFEVQESSDLLAGRQRIRDLCALSRLWFLLAVATLYVTAQGLEVVATGQRRWVDPHWFRGNSDPKPAMASRQQHDQRTYRIEFKIHMYCYVAD